MKELTQELLDLKTAELLERENFRNWALRPEYPSPAGYPEVLAARAILTGLKNDLTLNTPGENEKAADFAGLMARLSSSAILPDEPAKPTRIRRQKTWFALAAAAMVAVLLMAGALLMPGVEPTQFTTGNGERLNIELPDGTTVTLNANSSLTLDGTDWGATDRTVTLEGEAFFRVAKSAGPDGAKAFVVRTDDLAVRVLGTRFNVRERRGQSGVFLEEGNVSVSWPGTEIPEANLKAGEMIVRKEVGQLPTLRPVSVPAQVLSWRQGRLEFDQTPLRNALNELSDIYGIELLCQNDELLNRKISSAGIPTDNQQLALQLMEKALGLRIERLDDIKYEVTAAE
jgi:ferric-dicitrate binding protein FerR (iron transport regulator)